MAPTGEWQLVQRWRRFPDGWRTPADDELDKVQPYNPYPAKLTYAQVTAATSHGSGHSTRSNSTNGSPRGSQTSSRSSSPKTPKDAYFFYSPHSPTLLRFPPQATYSEWRGRCFRCCRTGHTQAKCRNPFKCGRCWKDGHVSSHCTVAMLNPAALPFHPVRHSYKPVRSEPSFEELLKGPKPPKPMLPDGRPKRLTIFVERDDEFFKEVDSLSNAVVLYAENQGLYIEVHQVVRMVMETKLVSKDEISVAQLTRERFLIHLPRGLAVETFVKALPANLWDQGFSFQQWSLLDDAEVKMPRFKVLLDLVGLPIHQWRDINVSKAVAQLGVYLGSVQPEHASDLSAFRVAIGTDDLMRIPDGLDVVVGGLTYPVEVVPVRWEKGPIYNTSDFPILPQRFAKPPTPPKESQDELDHAEVEALLNTGPKHDDDCMIMCSKRVIMELCQGRDLSSIPSELREFVYGAQMVGEISLHTLNELVFATEDQTTAPNREHNLSEEEIVQATQFGHSQSESQPPTSNLGESSNPRWCTPDGTNPKSVLESEEFSVQGTGFSGSQNRTLLVQSCEDQQGSVLDGTSGAMPEAGHDPPQPQPDTGLTDLQRPQEILEGPRTGVASGHTGTKHVSVVNFSRGNMFRGMMGRGRGRCSVPDGARRVAGRGFNLRGHKLQTNAPGMPQRIKGKGPASKEGKNKEVVIDKGAESKRRFQWRREAHQGPVQEGPVQILKRKTDSPLLQIDPLAQTSAQQKHQRTAAKESAQIDLNQEKYFEVQVDKDQCLKIGAACGFQTEEVVRALADDNEERRVVLQAHSDQVMNEVAGMDQVNLDSTSDDDLTDEEC